MPNPKKRRKATPRQELGIKLALTLALPSICPRHNLEENLCKETGFDCFRPELDNESSMDYRLCESFSKWFWETVKKDETEGLIPSTPIIQSSKATEKTKETKEETA